MSGYFIDLKDLAQDKVSFAASFEPGMVDFGGEIRQAGPLEWAATAERAGAEIRINGNLSTTIECPCSRCLEAARVELKKPFDLFFRERDEEMFDEDEEVQLDEEDTRTAFFTGTKLAIADILREQVLLTLPMKVLCRLDCKGLCPVCGINLNTGACTCSKQDFSPHMDVLAEIKKRMENRSESGS